jgi:hypothetical protein
VSFCRPTFVVYSLVCVISWLSSLLADGIYVPPECSETSVSHFKMHQNRFRRSPDPLPEIGEGQGREGKGRRGGEGEEGEEEGEGEETRERENRTPRF